MSFAIFYAPDGYRVSRKKLMGRNAAGASFLRGFMAHYRSGRVSCVVDNDSDGAEFRSHASKFQIKDVAVYNRNQTKTLPGLEGVYYPGPDIGELAYQRVSVTSHDDSWSLCGITHTTSSMRAMDAIVSWATSPVQPWDSIICTSTSVKRNVETVVQARFDELRERLGVTKKILPMVPVIPLGVHTKDFEYSATDREQARDKLGIKEGTLVVLYTGRLSFHAKAHPMAMYQAIETSARTAGKEVVLVECGWHATEHIKDAFADAAKQICGSIRTITLDGREQNNRDIAWASADVFCSLSDNIQETFGIVPIEAMAAGLPVVVSDWDGYKDTVRHEIDGFRIPTLAPMPNMAGDLSYRHAIGIDSYDMYCGYSSSLVAVSLPALVNAFTELFQSDGLRKKMGAAGRQRAREVYDWTKILPIYEALWEEQTKIRLAAKNKRGDSNEPKVRRLGAWPGRLDPTVGFANYPTQHLSRDTTLMMSVETASEAMSILEEYRKLAMVSYADYLFPPTSDLKAIFRAAESSNPVGCSAGELISAIPSERQPFSLRCLAFLCKLGLLHFR